MMTSAPVHRLLSLALMLAALSTLVTPSRAEGLTATETHALEAVVTSFTGAVRANDNRSVFRHAPTEVLEAMAQGAGISLDEFLDAANELVDEQLAELSDMDFALAFDEREVHRLPDGSPYVLVPTQVRLRTPDGRLATLRSWVLAIPRGDTWSVLQMDNGVLTAALEDAFPAFANVTFPETEVLRMEEP